MDEIVGRMMDKISGDPDATLMVMSDHGFSPFSYQVDLNLWLVENGFMKLKGSSLQKTDKKLAELLKGGSAEYFEYVDWSGTKAYSMGLGQIYINKKGREPLGVVEDQDYDSVCDDIAAKLSVLKDEREGRNNASVIAHVKKRSEIWSGPYGDDAHDCPDLQVCFHSSYRVAWQTCLGGISTGKIVDDNLERWSGDHCSMNPDEVPGMFFCNKKIKSPDVSIYDFCPTVLRYFGLKVPKDAEGKDLQVI
ncbi:MAG: alkaline phosphatase family protein [Candidatus Hinthialibacter sp.]